MHVCPQCQGDRLVNSGAVAGKLKKLCKQGGFQFTRTTPRGKPLTMKSNAVLGYLSDTSMHRIAFLLQVSVQSVLNWLRTFAKAHEEKPEPTGKTQIPPGLVVDRWASSIESRSTPDFLCTHYD